MTMDKNNEDIILACKITKDGLKCRVMNENATKKKCQFTREIGIGLTGPIANLTYSCEAEKFKDVL